MLKIVSQDGKWRVMSADSDEPMLICDSEEEAKAWVEKFGKTDSKATKGVLRYDATGTLKQPKKMGNGWLKVDGYLTRTGVFTYRNPDGSKRRELRLPEDVFHADTLESMSMLPVTDDHPPIFLNAKNTADYQRGNLSDTITRDGKFVRGAMMITDAALVKKLETGKAVEISMGYRCDLEETSGVTDGGDEYDFIQRNIRANHAAIVPAGRAGPEARVRMDSAAGVMVSIVDDGSTPAPKPDPQGAVPVKKIRIDGVEYEAGSEQAVAAQVAYQAKLDAEQKTRADADAKRADADAKRDAEIKLLKENAEKNQARADAADEAAKKAAKELKDAPARVAAEIKARMQLEASVRPVLGKKFKFDSLDDKAIRVAVLKELSPDLKLDGKSEAYIEARFDAALEAATEEGEENVDGEEDGEEGSAAARGVVRDTEDGEEELEAGDPAGDMTDDEANATHTDRAEAYDAMCHRNRNAWKSAIGGTAQ